MGDGGVMIMKYGRTPLTIPYHCNGTTNSQSQKTRFHLGCVKLNSNPQYISVQGSGIIQLGGEG